MAALRAGIASLAIIIISGIASLALGAPTARPLKNATWTQPESSVKISPFRQGLRGEVSRDKAFLSQFMGTAVFLDGAANLIAGREKISGGGRFFSEPREMPAHIEHLARNDMDHALLALQLATHAEQP